MNLKSIFAILMQGISKKKKRRNKIEFKNKKNDFRVKL